MNPNRKHFSILSTRKSSKRSQVNPKIYQLYRRQKLSRRHQKLCRRQQKISHRHQLLQLMMNLVQYLSRRKNLPNLQKYVIDLYVIAMTLLF